MGRVKIKSVVDKDPTNITTAPILVKFEHAVVNPNVDESVDLNKLFGTAVFETDISASSSKDMSHLSRSAFDYRSKSSESSTSKRKQVVALQSDEMTYIGTKGFDNSNVPTSSADDMMKTYVALRDNKKLRIFEVTPVTVSPYLKGHSYVTEEPKVPKIEQTKEEKRIDLMKLFGSKRKRLYYERLEKNKIELRDMEDSIASAVNTLDVNTSEPAIRDFSILTLVPPCNREATDAHDVYHLEDILSDEEINAMDDVAEEFLNDSQTNLQIWKQKKLYSDYFLAMMAKLQAKRQDSRVLQTTKIVLYTELLIIFLKMKHDDIRKKSVELSKSYPLWLKEKVLDNFTTTNANGTRNRPEAYKDKTCCYIMVLVLLVNDLQFDVQLMSTSLNFHIKKLLALAKAVGITVKYNPNLKEYKAMLKLPMPNPIENRGRRMQLH